MPLDLEKLGHGGGKALLEPRAIYNASQRPWPYLRHEQGEVLERWFDRRTDRDVVIKQNTGGGKTAVGLLIAQSTLNEVLGPAVYLAPDTYLAEQVRNEANKIGLPVTDNFRDPPFRAGEATFVTTFQKLINGRSVFGVAGDGRDIPQLGIVVVDDAHAALATTEGQFRLTIPNTHEAYDKLLDKFESDLKLQSRRMLADIRADDYTAVMRVPFWTWSQHREEIFDLLHEHRGDAALEWSWPLVADVLPLCNVTVTSRAIEIRPPCPPIAKIPAFVRAKRRIYLTATLADDSVLVTDLDADPDLVRRPVTPGNAADLGERIILAPLELNPEVDEAAILDLARQYAAGDRDGDGVVDATPVNAVVLVPSDKVADKWRPFADRVCKVGDLAGTVGELRRGHVGLVVLVNKYDGVDLPGDACRLLVIDGVPRPLDGAERRELNALATSPAFKARYVQRLEQGMGRGVRDTDDHCVVLLLGTDLAMSLHDPAQRALLSPATKAQVALSRELAAQIAGEGMAAVRLAIDACLDRDTHWVQANRLALANVTYDEQSLVRPEAVAGRRAFELASAGKLADAAAELQRMVGTLNDRAQRGWLGEQRAAYVNAFDPVQGAAHPVGRC